MRELFSFPVASAGVISDAPRISSIFLNVLNFLLSIVSLVAIIALIVAGFLYLTAYGDERKLEYAKRISIGAVVGIIIAFGGLIITKTIAGFFG